MKKLVHIIDEMALAAADVNKLAIQSRAAICNDMKREAKDKLQQLFHIQRQLGVLTNTVRDVMDAMDADDIEEIREVVGA